jgi:hypothetical protein
MPDAIEEPELPFEKDSDDDAADVVELDAGGDTFGDAADSDTGGSDGDTGQLTDTEDGDIRQPDIADGDGADSPDVADVTDTTDSADALDAPDVADVVEGPCLPNMALIEPAGAPAYCVDLYEASRANATKSSGGNDVVSPPKSKPGVLPWIQVTNAAADEACGKAGKRLCTFSELSMACAGPDDLKWVYGDEYDGSKCNGHLSGLASAAETASQSFSECVSADGIHDLSGNVTEWTSTLATNGVSYCAFGGDYPDPTPLDEIVEQAEESCDPVAVDTEGLTKCIAWEPTVAINRVGFRCCADPMPTGDAAP